MQNIILATSQTFKLFGRDIAIYGVLVALGFLITIVICCLNAKRRGFKTDELITLACFIIPLAIIGARIYYVIFSLDHYTNFWDIFKVWEGGLAFYGGLIGGVFGTVLYCLIYKKNILALADIILPVVLLGHSVGRIGCYFGGCCYGVEVTDPNLQWFPLSTQIDGVWHLSTFFYESLWDFLAFVILMIVLWTVNFKHNGMVGAMYFIVYGLGRAIIESFRGDSLYIGSMKVSQFLSIIFITAGLAFVLYYIIKDNFKKKDSFDKIMSVLKKDL